VPGAYFLHYAAHSHYEQGIFAPYATLEEAERQAAWDIHHGCDPAFIEGIFEAEYTPRKFAWTELEAAVVEEPHLDPKRRKKRRTRSQLAKATPKLVRKILAEQAQQEEERLLALHKAIEDGSAFTNAVPGNAYAWATGGTATAGPAALSAATAKTLVLILSAATNQPCIVEIGISFDGVTASAVPVLVELVSGTAGTAGTPRATLAAGKQLRGWPTSVSGTTCGDTYAAEPTTQLVNKKWLVTPNGGQFVLQSPLGREPTGIITAATDAKTWSLRATAPAIVNAHAYIEYEE
jgi:hypothetical protein